MNIVTLISINGKWTVTAKRQVIYSGKNHATALREARDAAAQLGYFEDQPEGTWIPRN